MLAYACSDPPFAGIEGTRTQWFEFATARLYSTVEVLEATATISLASAAHDFDVHPIVGSLFEVAAAGVDIGESWASFAQVAELAKRYEAYTDSRAFSSWFRLGGNLAESYVVWAPVPKRNEFDAGFHQYLDVMTAPKGRFAPDHIERVRQVWTLISDHFGGLFPLPVAMPTGDGALQLSWTRGHWHASVDVYADSWEWFFRDRDTGDFDGDELENSIELLPEALKAHLALLVNDVS